MVSVAATIWGLVQVETRVTILAKEISSARRPLDVTAKMLNASVSKRLRAARSVELDARKNPRAFDAVVIH